MSNNKEPKVETRWGPKITFTPAVFLLIALWIYALAWAWSGYPIYRDMHIGAALEYASNGIDLLRPVIVGFNAGGTATPQELPLWQAAASLGLNLFGGWWGGATLASLVLFTIFLPCFYQTARWETDATFAWLAVALLLAQPIVFHLAGGAGTDGFSLALLLGFVWSAEWLRREPAAPSWMACAFLASLLAVTKFPYLMTGGFAAALMLLWQRAPLKSWLLLAGAAAAAAAVFLPWNSWCNAEIGRALFKYRPMTISENPEWFFGSFAYRLDPANYVKAGWRALSCLWGSFVLVALTLYGLWLRPKSLGAALLVGAIATTLIFTKLVLVHRHYYLMFSPAIALLNGYALYALWQQARPFSRIKRILASAGMLAVLVLSLIQGLMQIEALTPDPFMKRMANIVQGQTESGDKLVIANGGWGGDLLILAERQGLSADSSSIGDNAESLAKLKELGFSHFVALSESPLLHSQQITNPGSTDKERLNWSAFLSASSQQWVTIYESDSIVIKKLP
jgi:hypothetical protein